MKRWRTCRLLGQVVLYALATPLGMADDARVTITGEVLTLLGAPLPDAVVEVRSAEGKGHGPTTRSRADGSFRLEGVSPGPRTIVAMSPGFAREEISVAVGAGEEPHVVFGMRLYRLTDTDPYVVEARVVDAGGRPLPGATVVVLPVVGARGGMTVRTGGDGRCHLRLIDPGEYLIYGFAKGFSASSQALVLSGKANRREVVIALQVRDE